MIWYFLSHGFSIWWLKNRKQLRKIAISAILVFFRPKIQVLVFQVDYF